jgi:hypothetical protein
MKVVTSKQCYHKFIEIRIKRIQNVNKCFIDLIIKDYANHHQNYMIQKRLSIVKKLIKANKLR